MALRAGALEDRLALLLELVERKVGIGEHRCPGDQGVGQRADARVRELHELEGREIVEHLLRRGTLHLRVVVDWDGDGSDANGTVDERTTITNTYDHQEI